MLLLGAGPRALLLQLAHPDVAAGVADHSDFQLDPWGRLHGTLRSYLRIIYGSTRVARAEIRRLHALHATVVGEGYTARDPALAMWVHATLIESTIVANDAWLGPLSRGRAAAFYEETRPLGRAFGVPDAMLPRDVAGFGDYMTRMLAPDGPVHVSTQARELAKAVIHPPLPGALVRLGIPARAYDWALWPAAELLPESVRAEYGFATGGTRGVVAWWLLAGWRGWNRWLPAAIREMPQARAADRRVREAGPGWSVARHGVHRGRTTTR